MLVDMKDYEARFPGLFKLHDAHLFTHAVEWAETLLLPYFTETLQPYAPWARHTLDTAEEDPDFYDESFYHFSANELIRLRCLPPHMYSLLDETLAKTNVRWQKLARRNRNSWMEHFRDYTDVHLYIALIVVDQMSGFDTLPKDVVIQMNGDVKDRSLDEWTFAARLTW